MVYQPKSESFLPWSKNSVFLEIHGCRQCTILTSTLSSLVIGPVIDELTTTLLNFWIRDD